MRDDRHGERPDLTRAGHEVDEVERAGQSGFLALPVGTRKVGAGTGRAEDRESVVSRDRVVGPRDVERQHVHAVIGDADG